MNWNIFKKVSTISAGGALIWYFNKHEIKTVFNATTWDYDWDKRHREFTDTKIVKRSADKTIKEETQPRIKRHLILIRHGQYNLRGMTDQQRILTELGRAQAKRTGERLKQLEIPFDNVVISTMSRAQETAKIILEQLPKSSELPITNEPLIEEGLPIAPEPKIDGLPDSLVSLTSNLNLVVKYVDFFKIRKDGSRIETGFRNYFHRATQSQEKNSYTLMVCHANVIRYFVCRALQFPPEAWLRLNLNHASITWITICDDGDVFLHMYGDSGHMPLEFIST